MRRRYTPKMAICINYAIIALDYIVAWALPLETTIESDIWILALGIVLLFFVPISAAEKRKEMTNWVYAFLTILLILVLGMLLSYVYYSIWVFVITVIETLLLAIMQLSAYIRSR